MCKISFKSINFIQIIFKYCVIYKINNDISVSFKT